MCCILPPVNDETVVVLFIPVVKQGGLILTLSELELPPIIKILLLVSNTLLFVITGLLVVIGLSICAPKALNPLLFGLSVTTLKLEAQLVSAHVSVPFPISPDEL